jgi:signal transduction histidine kinase
MDDNRNGQRELLMTSSARDGFAQLSVMDEGSGFDQATMDRLFEPFFTTKPHGTGMGLAINRTIIDAHGGRIWATSNDECGATFHLQLPAMEQATAQTGQSD